MGKNRIVAPGKATLLKRDPAEVQNMVEGLVVTTEGTRSGCTFVHALQSSQREGRQLREDQRTEDMKPLRSE